MKQAAFPPSGESFVDATNAVQYSPDAYKEIRHLIAETFIDESFGDIKYISKKVHFRGIDYWQRMCVCIGKNEFGNFNLCKVEYIIINESYTNIAFVGERKEITFNSLVGVYEDSINECENKQMLFCFPFSSLLSPDPIPEIIFANLTAYLPKYAPLDADS